MAGLTIITGRAGSGKTTRIMRQIADAVAHSAPGQLLLIPEQYSHEAEKELCRVCGDRLSLYGEVLSFTRLAALVEEELSCRRMLLDKGGRLLAMKVALRALEGRLKVYGTAQRRPENLTALIDLLSELKSAEISAAALEAAAEKEGGALGEKLRDFALILAAYDAVTSQGGADPADRLTLLAQDLPRSTVGTRGHIYIDGFTDFTAQEISVIAALMDKNVPVTVCLTCDSLSDGSEVFDAPRKTALHLIAMEKERGLPVQVEQMQPKPGQDASALSFLEQHLFTYTPEHCDDASDAVRLFTAPDEMAECALAAATCLELVRTRACRWRDIAVAVRGFSGYARMLESVFAYYGVPLYIGRRSAVTEKPLPLMLANAFEVLSGGWDGKAVLAWLKTGLCGAETTELDELENYALQWDLRGGIWTRPEPWTLSVAGFNERETEEDAQTLAALDALRRKLCMPLKNYELASDAAQTARTQAQAFVAFLKELDLAQTLSDRAKKLSGRGLGTLAAEYAQLWELLIGAVEQFASVLGDMPMEREEFGPLLLAMLAQYDIGTIPAAQDTVSAGEMDRMRRRHLKHLIVLGASDDRLPAPEKPELLLTAEEREALAMQGLGLSSPRGDGLYRELALIYNCLTLPSETLTMSYPLAGGEGETRPSVIFTRLARLTGKEPRSSSRAQVMLAAPAPAMELAAEKSGAGSAAARAYFAENEQYSARLRELDDVAEVSRGSLSEGSVRALYGEKGSLSATRAESYAQCGYAYFLKYGLAAKKRARAEFDPPEMGKFMHFVLEHVTREAMETGGIAQLDDRRRDALVRKYIEQYVRDVLHDFRDKSARFVYLFRRLTDMVRQVAADMFAELAAGDFVPYDFELNLSALGNTLTDGENSVTVTGVADRVDGWLHDGKLYLRVVDYKTGKKSFSLSDVWYGMGLQMLLYLFTLEKTGARRYGQEIVPAGVMYMPARDVLVRAKSNISDEEIVKERAKQLRRSGLLLQDPAVIEAMEHGDCPQFIPVKFGKDGRPAGESLASLEQLGKLAGHIEKTLLALAKELRGGNIDASPAFRSVQDNACQWCDYREICRFDETKDRRRWQTKRKAEEVWSCLGASGKEENA
ncbi:MAG: PD-(D/E)XK nuclease family protein [Oscillospiraceae bacterium]|nr:PD-(D/E)XK nuclease family protein [Oscillospiraceae bacterium]